MAQWKMTRYFIGQKNGAFYLIDVDKREEWDEIPADDPAIPDWATIIDNLSQLTFNLAL